MSRIRGWLIFGYGLIWFIALAAGFGLIDNFVAPGNSMAAILLSTAIAAALVGGSGGTTAMLQRLARDSSAPSFFLYLLQPITGLIAGILSLGLVSLPGALLVNYAATRTLELANLAASSTFVALYLLLAWLAGYQLQNWWAKRRASTAPVVTKPATAPEQPAPVSPLAFQIWAERQQRMSRWSVTWGVLILVYGIIWLAGLLTALIGSDFFFPAPADDSQPLSTLLAAGWPALLAGAIGGVIGMLYDLYRRISFTHDFDRQDIVAYPVLPLTGLVLGGAMYLFIASGYFSYKALVSQAPPVVDAPAVITIYLVLGWVAGFRQNALQGLVRRLIQSVISFFRSILSLFSPKLLWDQASRADALSEIAKQRELFRPLDRD